MVEEVHKTPLGVLPEVIKDDGADTTPRPDPTRLTTQQMLREVENLRNLVVQRIDALQELVDERFRSSDIGVQAAFAASEKAIGAAITAAERAVALQNTSFIVSTAKSEAATDKRLVEIGSTASVTVSGLRDQIDDLKTRLTAIESGTKGSKDLLGVMLGFAGIAVAIGAAIIAVLKQ